MAGAIAPRYKLSEKIDSDYITDNYRAVDQVTGGLVIVRIFKTGIAKLSLVSQLRFKREVESISKLHHDNVLRVFGLDEYETSYFLVTEAFEGRPLQHPSGPMDLDETIAIIEQIASGLEFCHQNGIVHQYLNPDNILIAERDENADPESRRAVKITGFGYNWLFDPVRIRDTDEIRKVFGYMSPEVCGILHAQPDSRADIYSLGILFYELICGELPYTGPDLSALIHQHISQRPKPPSELNKAVPKILDQIVLRLIAKEPQDRYQSLSALIADLKEYQNQKQQGIEIIDFVIAREDRLKSLTYSAPLVGRNRELDILKSYFDQTALSRGNLCLVYGEAGIGKSRLVDELREHVHAAKGIFIKGKSNQYEFQTPYRVFSRALRSYVDNLERRSNEDREVLVQQIKKNLGDLAGEALKIAPEMKRFLRGPNELVELDAEKERTRFLITVTSFLLNLGTPEIPAVIFLDDLQWADRASIELLEKVAERIHSYPILVIAGFRDTEVKENHPLHQTMARLRTGRATVTEFHLKGVALEDAREMLSRVLFEDEDSISELASDLHRRTEGNPFFLIELLHSYVDQGIVYITDNHYRFEASRAKQVVIPSNVVDLVLKRIDELSDRDSTILSYAAVIGRKVKFEMLERVSPFALQEILPAIEEGVKRQFMAGDRTENGDILFAHDRIQEAFYKRLSDEERILLHSRVASWIEAENKDHPEPVVFELAHHFSQAYAGYPELEEKTLFYCLQAAKKAQAAYAHDQAVRLYKQAGQILEKQGKKESSDYIDILENLGSVYKTAGRFDEALEVLKACEELIPEKDALRRAEVLSKAGDTLWEKGEGNRATELLEQALESLGVKLPGSMFGVAAGLLKESLIQGLHTIFPGLFVRKEYRHDAKKAVIVRILLRVAYFYYFNNAIKCLHLAMKYLNMGERMGPSRVLSNIYSTHTVIVSGLPLAVRAKRYGELGVKVAQDLHDRAAEGSAYSYFAVSTYSNRGAEEAYAHALKSIELLKGVGEYWDLGVGLNFRTLAGILVGKSLNEVLEDAEETITIARNANSPQMLGWGLYGKAFALALIGDERARTEGIKAAQEAIEVLVKAQDKPNSLLARSFLAFAYDRAGMYDEAVQVIEEVARLFPKHNNKAGWIHSLFPIGAQIYLDCIRHKPGLTEEEKQKYLKRAKHICRRGLWRSFLFPYIRSHTDQVNGACRWLSGDKKKAVETWEKAIAHLRNHTKDTYRLASVLLEEASFLLEDNPEDAKARQYLFEAGELFSRLAAKLDDQRVDQLLGMNTAREKVLDSCQILTLTRQLDSLLSVTRAIGSVFVLEELLDKIVDQAMMLTGAERGFLFLYDEGGILQEKVARGIGEKGSAPFSFADTGISLAVIQQVESKQEGFIQRRDENERAEIASELEEYGVKEALCVPLKAQEKFLGIIYLDNRMAGGVFGREELTLMNSVAVQASISIQNAYLIRDLIEEERSLQQMIEQAPDSVIVYDFEGRILNVNQQACDSLGYTRNELLNMMVADIRSDFGDDKRLPLLDNLKIGPLTMPSVHRRKNGSTFPVEERMSIIDYRSRKAVLALARDVTERNKLEAEMQKIERLESLGILAGGIAHDFNNLLTAIIGNLSLIEVYAELGKDFSGLLDAVLKASHRATHLTKQLLTFSKGGEPIKKKVSLPELLREAADLALSGSPVGCDFVVPGDLWWAEIDEGQINQAVSNIIINAKQAMPEGGTIRISAENVQVGPDDDPLLAEGRYVRVSIRDRGIGIPKEDLNRIFDPYFTTKPQGTGLGLATTFSIIKRHGGHISVESEPGRGTTFFLYLPAADPQHPKAESREKGVFRGKSRILVMDDQKVIRDMLQAMLTHLGYEMEYAKDGAEAVELYRNKMESGKGFDAVILDLTIPGGLGGKETMKKLLELDRDARVVVSSGYSNDPIMSEYRRYGFKGIVTKPYEMQALSKVLHQVMRE